MSKNTIIQSIDRALNILNLFKENRLLGVTEISEKMNLAKSTTYGLIASLKEHNYLEKDSDTNKYRLGLSFLEMSSIIYSRINIRQVALPIMQKLVDQYDETVQLAILDNNKKNVIYIECIESLHGVKFTSRIGVHSPAHCVATGKVMLAEFSEETINNIYSNEFKFNKLTPNSISNLEELKKELELVRKRGYSIDDEESEIGLWGVAAPIKNYLTNVVAAVSIGGPVARIDNNNSKKLVKAITKSAYKISKKIGYEN